MDTQAAWEFGPFRLDPVRRLLLRNGGRVPLPPKALDILLVLIEQRGQVVEKDQLLARIWSDCVVEENNLTRHVSSLRKALGEAPDAHEYIVTIPGRGYSFVATVLAQQDLGIGAAPPPETPVISGAGEEHTQRTSADTVVASAARENRRPPLRAWSRGVVPVLALAGLCLMAAALYQQFRDTRPTVEKIGALGSIAILPFGSIGSEPERDFHAVGLADALITRLSNASRIVVRPTSAILRFSNEGQDPMEAGRLLKVDWIVEGRLQRTGRRVRATVRLWSVGEGRSVWADRFDVEAGDIFTVQDSISARVAQALPLALTAEERKRLTRRQTADPEAYQLYSWGRYFWNKRTPAGFKRAVEYFEAAIAKDPNYALAHAGLADCYNLLGSQYLLPQPDAYRRAKQAAITALQIDDTVAEAHASLAYASLQDDWDWAGAERRYRRALELNPNYASAHHWYAWELMLLGRTDESAAHMRRAAEIDPLSLAANIGLGLQFYYLREYGKAIEQYRRSLEMDPAAIHVHSYLVHAYARNRMYDEALAEEDRWIGLASGDPATVTRRRNRLARLKQAYATAGEQGYWREHARIAEAEPSEHGPAARAAVYAQLGDSDRAFALLERAYTQREEMLLYLKVDPPWDSLRADRRFGDLLRRVGLPP